MKKPTNIQLHIPKPCTQPWADMTISGQGRFCAHCQKTVIDFTTWNDAALYNFFSKNKERVCGHFFAEQLSRPINIPHQPQSRLYRLTVALGLTLLFAQTPHLLAQNRPPKVQQDSASKSGDVRSIIDGSGGEIAGTVFNDKREPVSGAVVHLLQNGIVTEEVTTDFDGRYIFKPVPVGSCNVSVKYNGFRGVIVTDVIVTPDQRTSQDIILGASHDSLTTPIVLPYKRPLLKVTDVLQQVRTFEGDVRAMPTLSISDISTVPLSNPYQKLPTKRDTIKLDRDNPTKRTITGEEVNQMPK